MEEETFTICNYQDIKLFAQFYPVKDDTITITLEFQDYRQLWLDYLLENPDEAPGSDNTIILDGITFKILMKK